MDDFDFFSDAPLPAPSNGSNSLNGIQSESLDSMMTMSPLDGYTFGDVPPTMSPLPLSVSASDMQSSNGQANIHSSHIMFDSFPCQQQDTISPNVSPNPFQDTPNRHPSNDRTGSIHMMKQQRLQGQLNQMNTPPSISPQHSSMINSSQPPPIMSSINNMTPSNQNSQSRIHQQPIQSTSPQQHPMQAPYYARSPSQHPYNPMQQPPLGPVTDHAYSPLNASHYAFPRTQPVSGHIPAMVNNFGISMPAPANVPRRSIKGELHDSRSMQHMAIPPTVTVNQPSNNYSPRSFSPQQHPQQFQQPPPQMPFGARPLKYHRHSMSHASGLHTLETYSSIPEDSPVHQTAVFPSFSVGHKSPPKKKGLTASASTPSLTTLEKSSKSRRPRTSVKTSQTSESSKKKSRLARKAELARASRKRKKAHLSGLEQEVIRLTSAVAEAEAQQAALLFDAQIAENNSDPFSHNQMPQLGRLRLDDPIQSGPINQLNDPYVMTSSSPQSSRNHKSPSSSKRGSRVVSAGASAASPKEVPEPPSAGFTSTPGDMHGTAAYLLARLRSIIHPGMQEQFALFAFSQAPYHLQPPDAPPNNNDAALIASATLNQSNSTLSQTGMFWHSLLRGELAIEDAQFESLKRHRDAALGLVTQVADLDRQLNDVSMMVSKCCDVMLDVKQSLCSVLGDTERQRLNEWIGKNEWVGHMLTSQLNLVRVETDPKFMSSVSSSSSIKHSASTQSLTNLDDEDDDSDDSDSS